MPTRRTRAWWNDLTPEQRRDEALHILGSPDPYNPWDCEWDELLLWSQRARLHMYFTGMLISSTGDPLRPIHKPKAGDPHQP